MHIVLRVMADAVFDILSLNHPTLSVLAVKDCTSISTFVCLDLTGAVALSDCGWRIQVAASNITAQTQSPCGSRSTTLEWTRSHQHVVIHRLMVPDTLTMATAESLTQWNQALHSNKWTVCVLLLIPYQLWHGCTSVKLVLCTNCLSCIGYECHRCGS